MGSGRLPAARVSRELWGGTLEQQPRHAAHAGAQVRALHRHVAWKDQVRRAVLGPVLLHVRSSRLRGSTTLVPPRGSALLLGTIFFSLYYLCLAEPLNKLGVNWLMGEFWFTAGATFAYFTAFVAMLVNFSEREDEDWQYWIDANIAAGVFGLLNDVFYGLGAYLIYVEWKANPTGAPAPPPA